ncbi:MULTISPECIES: hypothetical protein [unclassified Nostoc]|nr:MULTISPECIES: hypothetical protein [unclassified Nostoc]
MSRSPTSQRSRGSNLLGHAMNLLIGLSIEQLQYLQVSESGESK